MNELSKKARELKKAYQREWRRKNPEKVNQSQVRYWNRKALQITPEIQARELYKQGFTQREIAKQLSISLGTVNNLLNK